MNTNDPASSGEVTAAADTTTQHPDATEIGKQASHKGREAEGRGVQQDAGIEQAREVGAWGSASAAPAHGGGGRPRRLLLVGLDGATPELAIGAWRTELRALHMLTDRGARARIGSSIPWTSVPAWLSLLSGQDPGQLGIYGQKHRPNHSYAASVPIDSRAVHEPRLWDILGQAGKHVGVVGAPATTPAPHVHGHLIGDRLGEGEAIYPAELRRQVALWLEDDPPQPIAAENDIDLIVGDAYARTEQRFRLARRLLARDTYDCFVVHDDGIATVQRALWDSLDTTHRRYTPNHPSAGAISAFYRFVDEQIADLLELIDDDTVVAIVSACGAQALDGELALNDWLIAEGELTLRARPDRLAGLEQCDVDWEHTRAWADADGAIYLNIAGREPQGSIPSAEAEQVAAGLAARLRALSGSDLAQVQPGAAADVPAVEVYRPSFLYAAVRGVAPDLLAICPWPGWRTNALVGHAATWVSTDTAPMDAACESRTGFFVLYDPRNLSGGIEIEAATIYDIAPTLMAQLDQPIPPRMRGDVLIEG